MNDPLKGVCADESLYDEIERLLFRYHSMESKRSTHKIQNSSTVQNRMPVAGKEHHIDEEGEANAEEIARD